MAILGQKISQRTWHVIPAQEVDLKMKNSCLFAQQNEC